MTNRNTGKKFLAQLRKFDRSFAPKKYIIFKKNADAKNTRQDNCYDYLN